MAQQRHGKGTKQGGRFRSTTVAEMPEQPDSPNQADDPSQLDLVLDAIHKMDDALSDCRDRAERSEEAWGKVSAPSNRREGRAALQAIEEAGEATKALVFMERFSDQIAPLLVTPEDDAILAFEGPAQWEAQRVQMEAKAAAKTASVRAAAEKTNALAGELVEHLRGIQKGWARRLARQVAARSAQTTQAAVLESLARPRDDEGAAPPDDT